VTGSGSLPSPASSETGTTQSAPPGAPHPSPNRVVLGRSWRTSRPVLRLAAGRPRGLIGPGWPLPPG